jgi:hypothetical protein
MLLTVHVAFILNKLLFSKTMKRTTLKGLLVQLCAVAGFLLPACQSLDFVDPNAPAPATASIQSLVTGMEGAMRAGHTNFAFGLSAAGREAYYLDGLSDPRWITEYIQGALDPAGPFVNPFWGPRYRVMVAAQQLINRAQSFTPTDKAKIEGVANTLIGHQLMMVAAVFQRVTTQIPAPDDPRQVQLVSPSDGYAEAARRLDAGFQALQNAGAAFSGGANGFVLSRGYASFSTPAQFARVNRALRARLAIWQGDFAAANTALQQSFITADSTQMGLGAYLVFGTGAGDATNGIFEPPASMVIRFWSHPTFESECENPTQDRRFVNDVGAARPPFTQLNLTATRPFFVYKSNTDPIPVIRNEELLLIRAEINIRGTTPNIDAARNDLNIIRAAAGVPPYTATTFNAQNAVDRLLYERRYSLFGEGHRWIDMRRFNRLNRLPLDRPGDVIPQFYPVPITDGGGTN